ncbi:hypothetical protein KAU88_08650 [Candidatus Bathyarchaeota archaeon]|nr:hypothetical protein [Candidatus Bathyarchaeota archaeon]
MSEIHQIPIPLSNYIRLIERKKSPYYDLALYILADMEKTFKKSPHANIIYAINPRRLKEEMEAEIPSEKLTPINIGRTILALLYRSNLRKGEDYYVTTSSGGRRNYHIKVNRSVLSTLQMHL